MEGRLQALKGNARSDTAKYAADIGPRGLLRKTSGDQGGKLKEQVCRWAFSSLPSVAAKGTERIQRTHLK